LANLFSGIGKVSNQALWSVWDLFSGSHQLLSGNHIASPHGSSGLHEQAFIVLLRTDRRGLGLLGSKATAPAGARGWQNSWTGKRGQSGKPTKFLCESGDFHATLLLRNVWISDCRRVLPKIVGQPAGRPTLSGTLTGLNFVCCSMREKSVVPTSNQFDAYLEKLAGNTSLPSPPQIPKGSPQTSYLSSS
jgi:hypothetical protein